MPPTDTMTNPVKLLSDDEVAEIAARPWMYPYLHNTEQRVLLKVVERDALCQTVRVLCDENCDLRRSVEEWVTRYNEVDAWRSQLSVSNTALREHLAEAQKQPIPEEFVCVAPDEAPLVIGFLCGTGGDDDREIARLHLSLCARCAEIAEIATKANTAMREQLAQTRQAAVTAVIPYEALLLDSESRRWIAPEVWWAMESAVAAIREAVKEQL